MRLFQLSLRILVSASLVLLLCFDTAALTLCHHCITTVSRELANDGDDDNPRTAPLSQLIYVCIFMNILTLSFDAYGISAIFASILSWVDAIITIIFAAEMAFKVLIEGIWPYFSQNTADSFITIGCLVELFSNSGGGVSALRAFRMFR